jgi:hypothetical protein
MHCVWLSVNEISLRAAFQAPMEAAAVQAIKEMKPLIFK